MRAYRNKFELDGRLARGLWISVILLMVIIPKENLAAEPGSAATPAVEGSGEASLRFAVQEFRIIGNSKLPAVTMERVVYPYLGFGKSMAEVEGARKSLEEAYRAAGYGTVFVDIPEQSVGEGIVRLRVTEGRIDRVRITGARYFSNGQIRAALPALEHGEVPHLPAVQAELAGINGVTADRVVTPVLKAGRVPGTIDVELKVADTLPLHATVEVNDRYSPSTSRLRSTVSASYANLFQRQQSLSVQYQTAPEEMNELESVVGTYVFTAPAWKGTTFALYAVDSNSDVATVGTLAVIGNGQIYGFRAIHGLPGSAGFSHSVTFGLDYKDFVEDIRLVDSEGLVTPISYLNWSASYGGTSRRVSSLTSMNVTANVGIRGMLNDPVEFEQKRFEGRPNYFYLRGSVEHLQTWPLDFQLLGRVVGQGTPDPLVSNEQLSLGGADTVRGYPEAASLGDYGAVGTIELRHAGLSRLLGVAAGSAYLAAFYDAGIASLIDPLPGQKTSFSLSGAGVGIRIAGFHGLDLAVDWARALQQAGTIDDGDERAHFSVKYAF